MDKGRISMCSFMGTKLAKMMLSISDYIDGDKFESICDFSFGDYYTKMINIDLNVLDNFISNFNENRIPIIFVDSDRVINFFNMIENYEKPFILVSHNGDTTFNKDDILKKPKCVKKWYGQNINYPNNEEIISLPIGLERYFWSKQRYNLDGFKHKKIYEHSKLEIKKNKLLYVNFNIKTNPKKRGWVADYFNQHKWAFSRFGGINGDYELYLKECRESKFILCPDGNGIDCHRNWEMLYLGSIPVLNESIFHKTIYGDLPVCIVKEWTDLTENFLEKFYDDLSNKKCNLEKLYFTYWKNKIINNLW
jgi:hypothetical protein